MRVSADHTDLGFRSDAHASNYKVLLDGEEVDRVITADEEKGYILKYKQVDGEYVRGGDGRLETEELHGNVKIIDTRE